MTPRPNVSPTKYERLAREKRRIEAQSSGLNLARSEIEKIRHTSGSISTLKNGRHQVCTDKPEPTN